MQKFPFARARSRLAGLLNVKLTVCTRPLMFYFFANVQICRLETPQNGHGFPKHASLTKLTKLLTKIASENPLLIFEFPPARIQLLCALSNWPFARARSHLVALRIVKLAVCACPLVFYCFVSVQICHLDALQIGLGLPKHVSLTKLTKLLTKSASENPLVIFEFLPARIRLLCALTNWPCVRARSHSVALRITKLAVRARPLAFGCFRHCRIGCLRAPARIRVLYALTNLPFMRARSHSVALRIVKLAVCARPLAFGCIAH